MKKFLPPSGARPEAWKRRKTQTSNPPTGKRGECLLKMVSIDRISDLPDSLLHHIMSFLESQEAVQTCVLSKRWNNLWASLQYICLVLSKFKAGEDLNKRFTNFVNTLLLLHDTSDLHTFRLIFDDYDADVCHQTITTWIPYAIKRNAKVIEIELYVFGYKQLPQGLFISPSLEELKLSMFNIHVGFDSGAINLPKLKKLKLCVESNDSDILNKLALGCPALEELHLVDCKIDMCVVSFPKLKNLKITLWGKNMRVVSIRAPNLVSLTLLGYAQLFGEISIEKMPSLMIANISLWSFYCFDAEKCNPLHDVANVQTLELSGSTIQAFLERELPRCPTFFNVTTLFLRYFCMICYSNEVGAFLKHTPNLKKLTLCANKYFKGECGLEEDQGSYSIKSALFQCKNLDEIEVELKWIDVELA